VFSHAHRYVLQKEVRFTRSERAQTPMVRLYKHLFEGYHKSIRPVYNDSQSVNLTVQFWFKQILKVEESDQILTIYCWLEMVGEVSGAACCMRTTVLA
jgi:hypothetical protein